MKEMLLHNLHEVTVENIGFTLLLKDSREHWCKDNCNGNWNCYSQFNDVIFGFEKEEDAMAFKLRWA